jgi:hypothetical protein
MARGLCTKSVIGQEFFILWRFFLEKNPNSCAIMRMRTIMVRYLHHNGEMALFMQFGLSAPILA